MTDSESWGHCGDEGLEQDEEESEAEKEEEEDGGGLAWSLGPWRLCSMVCS